MRGTAQILVRFVIQSFGPVCDYYALGVEVGLCSVKLGLKP